ncbi:M20/M25/M40 family metallo-hydrolase [Methanoregula sp.]|uniref:M20/M25/M40 family metallo-hydrolase n=1 Tax=Methanoregula sp. TaxID=2052170 RepID=UPI002BC3D8DE|nr:M20/M25/M40 family metallo-hydrolase [Methanoregula sp.]HVP96955.1 M20/M25/M40 family metallo-hydrolase [Methanoregula sp.]
MRTIADPLTSEEIRAKVQALMPGVIDDLKALIRYPSVAFPGYPGEPVRGMADATVALLERYGLSGARLIDVPGGYPAVYGEIPAPPGMPTVLMYAHYDVQPATKEDGWECDPWDPHEEGGRLYGRGSADDKSGIMLIAASLRTFEGKPPVGIKVLIEGEEETTSHIEALVTSRPDLFSCDAFIIEDNGNLSAGEPALTTSLRGEVSCIIEVSTLDHPVHSGMFGGAAPDALVALIRCLATLHDTRGDVAVPGLQKGTGGGGDYPEQAYRESAGVLAGVDLTGTGLIGDRLWTCPSVTVIGIDAPSVQAAANILIPRAAAKVSMRIAPDADPKHELALLVAHLRAAVPWNARVTVQEVSSSPGFVCPTGDLVYAAARTALAIAFGRPVLEKGTGGSIPLLRTLQDTVLHAGFVLWGAEDAAGSRIHGTNESVDVSDLERTIVAQALFLLLLAKKQ